MNRSGTSKTFFTGRAAAVSPWRAAVALFLMLSVLVSFSGASQACCADDVVKPVGAVMLTAPSQDGPQHVVHVCCAHCLCHAAFDGASKSAVVSAEYAELSYGFRQQVATLSPAGLALFRPPRA